MTRDKPQIRYNAEMKKAITMGDEYDAYKTLTQFYAQEKRLLISRKAKATLAVRDFVSKGGTVEFDTECHRCVASFNDTSYTVEFDDEGGVERYWVENPSSDENNVLYLHWMFYCSLIIGRLDDAIAEVEIKLANLQNDILIRSVSKTAGTIAGDIYLTAGAVAGLDLRTDEDIDPFGIIGDD